MPSKKNISQLKDLNESFSKAKAIYFTEYHGLDVGDITELRSEFFKENFPGKILYAVKTNPNEKIIKQIISRIIL